MDNNKSCIETRAYKNKSYIKLKVYKKVYINMKNILIKLVCVKNKKML